jgi:hypothetical protein
MTSTSETERDATEMTRIPGDVTVTVTGSVAIGLLEYAG